MALRIALAATQHGAGARLTCLARAIGSPVSSTQTAIGTLLDMGLLRRSDGHPPRYTMDLARPAADGLIEIAAAITEPTQAIATLLRANPAVRFASIDAGGFTVAVDSGEVHQTAEALGQVLDRIRANHLHIPQVLRLEAREFDQLLGLDLLLRHRIEYATTIVNRHSWLGLTMESHRRRQSSIA